METHGTSVVSSRQATKSLTEREREGRTRTPRDVPGLRGAVVSSNSRSSKNH